SLFCVHRSPIRILFPYTTLFRSPVQVLLRQIVILASGVNYDGAAFDEVPPPEVTVKMATIVVATLPILLVYPFLQKYFAKGALLDRKSTRLNSSHVSNLVCRLLL